MRESKALYIEFCRSGYVPIQFQPWWLDAVCSPECWNVALATDGGGKIIGALPWFKKRRWGLGVLQQPPFTTYSGPWLCYPQTPDFKLHSRYTFEKKVFTELINQLPGRAFFIQNFRPEIENWLPFYWKGFHQTTRYTYIFDQTDKLAEITAGMKNTLRSDLKKAGQACEWRRDDEAWEVVFDLNALSLQGKRGRQPYDRRIFLLLHKALSERDQMACFIARDRISGVVHAGLYLVYDAHEAAVLLTGVNPAHKATCAIYGLFMEAIQYCGSRGLSLDFEGSMEPVIEHTFRAFGARQQPYFQVWKARNRFLELLFYLTR